jgi:hypothetical protein
MKRKYNIALLAIVFLALSAAYLRTRLSVNENNYSNTEISSSDEERNKTQTRADLIFLELLRKTLFGSN